MPLNGAQRTNLRGQAHGLRPLVHAGKGGVTQAVVAALDAALADHELVKVRFLDAERDEKRTGVERLERETSSECVGTIGHIAIFYRRQDDPDKRRIVLPG